MDAEYDTGGDSLGAIFGDLLEGLGREVVGEVGSLGKARQAGGFVSEELLDFLEGRTSASGGAGSEASDPSEELRGARDELATLKQLDDTLRSECGVYEQQAEAAKAAGSGKEELEAMRRLFDVR